MSSTYTAFKSMVANDLVRRLVAKNAQINMIFARYQTMPNERILKKFVWISAIATLVGLKTAQPKSAEIESVN